jgi:hypothetical protein
MLDDKAFANKFAQSFVEACAKGRQIRDTYEREGPFDSTEHRAKADHEARRILEGLGEVAVQAIVENKPVVATTFTVQDLIAPDKPYGVKTGGKVSTLNNVKGVPRLVWNYLIAANFHPVVLEPQEDDHPVYRIVVPAA